MGGTKKEREFDGSGLGRSGADLQDNQANRVGGIEGSSKVLCQADKSRSGIDLGQINVNPFELPFLPLGDRKSLPKKVSAIYFAISATNEVLYIGRAICLYTRWNGQKHHKQEKLEELGNIKIAWVEVKNSALLPEKEHDFISIFNPPLNDCNILIKAECRHRKWVAKKKTFNFSEQELKDLKEYCDKVGRTETDVIREALRKYLKADGIQTN